jgi:hypothetical protein
MSQTTILNFYPAWSSSESELIDLSEITVYDKDKTKLLSFYVPSSELAGKSDEQIGCIVRRAFLAFNIDVSTIEVDSDEAAKMIAENLARQCIECLVVNLMIIYAKRLKRGDGTDPEITVVEGAKDVEDRAAVGRIVNHFFSRTAPRLARLFFESRYFVNWFWQHFLRNIAGKTVLSIRQQKGDEYVIPSEEFLAASKQWEQFARDQSFRMAGERLASIVLNRLNPAGISFEDLQKIVRGGLDVSVKISTADLRGVIKGIEWKVTREKNLSFWVSGDGREIHITLPENADLSQNTIIKLLSSKLINRQFSKEQASRMVVAAATKLGASGEACTKRNLCGKLGWSESTFDNYEEDGCALMDQAKQAYTETMVKRLTSS